MAAMYHRESIYLLYNVYTVVRVDNTMGVQRTTHLTKGRCKEEVWSFVFLMTPGLSDDILVSCVTMLFSMFANP